jgi:hypothetical protein
MKLRLGMGGGGGGVLENNIFFSSLSSYFAQVSLHMNFHDPMTIPSGRKVCVVLVGDGWFEGKFSVSFGPKIK